MLADGIRTPFGGAESLQEAAKFSDSAQKALVKIAAAKKSWPKG